MWQKIDCIPVRKYELTSVKVNAEGIEMSNRNHIDILYNKHLRIETFFPSSIKKYEKRLSAKLRFK